MKDLIDRQAAIDYWRSIIDATDEGDRYNMGFDDGLEFCISDLSTMPSAEPERKTGKWIIDPGIGCKCSECDFDIGNDLDFMEYVNFCPNCGADMRGEQDE